MLIRYTKYLINSPKIFIFIILFSISLNAQTRRYEGKKKLKNKNSISNVSAQKGLTIIGGNNMSTIKYNDNKIGNQIDISAQNGSNIGLEYRFPRLIVGAGFLQRGSKLKEATTINIGGVDYEIEISGYEVYNYAAAHIFYPISISEQIEVFGGVQVGSSLGGTSVAKLSFTEFNSSQSDEIDMKPKGFGLDAGLQFGVDYMLNHRFGLRSSYYLGMTDVRDTLSNNLNFKNSTLSLSAIIKLKGLRKKPNIEKSAPKINSKSRLILPTRALDSKFDPIVGAEGWQISNAPILAMACLRSSMAIFSDAGMPAIIKKSKKLTGYLEYLIGSLGDKIKIITPKDSKQRGAQLSIVVKKNAKEVFNGLSSNHIICDWREPDVIRVAPVPLYNSFVDAYRFYEIVKDLSK